MYPLLSMNSVIIFCEESKKKFQKINFDTNYDIKINTQTADQNWNENKGW